MADPTEEMRELRMRLAEAEETLRAMRSGEVDALVIDGPVGPQVYTLKSAAEPYRLLVEQMAEGALTVSKDGLILFCNDSFARMLGWPRERIVGSRLEEHIETSTLDHLDDLLSADGHPGCEMVLCGSQSRLVDVHASSAPMAIDRDAVRCIVITDVSQQELRLRYAAVV